MNERTIPTKNTNELSKKVFMFFSFANNTYKMYPAFTKICKKEYLNQIISGIITKKTPITPCESVEIIIDLISKPKKKSTNPPKETSHINPLGDSFLL